VRVGIKKGIEDRGGGVGGWGGDSGESGGMGRGGGRKWGHWRGKREIRGGGKV